MDEPPTYREIDQRFEDQDRAVLAALQAERDRIAGALAANEKRLDAMNEFRDALKDRERDYLTRREFYSMVLAVLAILTYFAVKK